MKNAKMKLIALGLLAASMTLFTGCSTDDIEDAVNEHNGDSASENLTSNPQGFIQGNNGGVYYTSMQCGDSEYSETVFGATEAVETQFIGGEEISVAATAISYDGSYIYVDPSQPNGSRCGVYADQGGGFDMYCADINDLPYSTAGKTGPIRFRTTPDAAKAAKTACN